MPEIRFAVPGDLETRTGGYIYDRRLMAELRRLGYGAATIIGVLLSCLPSMRNVARPSHDSSRTLIVAVPAALTSSPSLAV